MRVTSRGHARDWWHSIAAMDEKVTRAIGAFFRPLETGIVASLKLIGPIGQFLGAIGTLIVYFGVWLAAADSAGWVIGIALGWIPAAIAAGIAYFVLRYLWWLFLLIAIHYFH